MVDGVLAGFPGLVVRDKLNIFEQSCTLVAKDLEAEVRASREENAGSRDLLAMLNSGREMATVELMTEVLNTNVQRRIFFSFSGQSSDKFGQYAVCICGRRIITPKEGVAVEDDLLGLMLLSEIG